MEGILEWWIKKSLVKDEPPAEVVVHRGKILQSTLRVVISSNSCVLSTGNPGPPCNRLQATRLPHIS